MQISWLGLEGKSVIVTGAASGIGKAVAQEFLNCGANVAVCDLNPQTPEFEINENSGKMIYLHTNVCDAQNVKETVKRVCEEFGTVDVIVNNAGINIPSLLVDDKEEHSKYELNENIYETIKINHFILYFVFVGNCEGYGGTIGVIGYTYGKN